MALFRNFGVNHAKEVTGLRNRLCGIQKYASAQFFDFLERTENCSFLEIHVVLTGYTHCTVKNNFQILLDFHF